MEPEYNESWLENIFRVLNNLETRILILEGVIKLERQVLPDTLPDNVIIFPGRDE